MPADNPAAYINPRLASIQPDELERMVAEGRLRRIARNRALIDSLRSRATAGAKRR